MQEKESNRACPICGSPLVEKYNYVTREVYIGCSQTGCFFRIGEKSKIEEYSLQGRVMKGKCLGCGSPLIVTNGPHGLYARCFNCNYDYNSQTRFGNAKVPENRDEIVSMIKEFKRLNENNSRPDELKEVSVPVSEPVQATLNFDTSVEVKKEVIEYEPPYAFNINNLNTLVGKKEEICRYMKANLDKPVSSSVLTSVVRDLCPGNSRTVGMYTEDWSLALRELKQEGKIKMVGRNNAVLYQLIESPLPEIVCVSREDGYITFPEFYDSDEAVLTAENMHKYRFSIYDFKVYINDRLKLKSYWMDSNIKGNGFYKNGYFLKDLKKAAQEFLQIKKADNIDVPFKVLQDNGDFTKVMSFCKKEETFTERSLVAVNGDFEENITWALLLNGDAYIDGIEFVKRACDYYNDEKVHYTSFGVHIYELPYTLNKRRSMSVDWSSVTMNIFEFWDKKHENTVDVSTFLEWITSQYKFKNDLQLLLSTNDHYTLGMDRNILEDAYDSFKSAQMRGKYKQLSLKEKSKHLLKYLRKHPNEEYSMEQLSEAMSGEFSQGLWAPAIKNLREQGYIKVIDILASGRLTLQYIKGPGKEVEFYKGEGYTTITNFCKSKDSKVYNGCLDMTLTSSIRKQLDDKKVFMEPNKIGYPIEDMDLILAERFKEVHPDEVEATSKPAKLREVKVDIEDNSPIFHEPFFFKIGAFFNNINKKNNKDVEESYSDIVEY